MKVRFLTLAQQEVDEAVIWFDQKVEGKGFAFLDELDRVVRLVQAYPLAATEIEPEIRRFLFARFLYSLIYMASMEIRSLWWQWLICAAHLAIG